MSMKSIRSILAAVCAASALAGSAKEDPVKVTIPTAYSSGGYYRYCPSALVDEDGTRHVFYCRNKDNYEVVDHIYHATVGANGAISDEAVVLSPSDTKGAGWDSYHVCDPSVIAGAFYYNAHVYKYLMAYLGVKGKAGDASSDGAKCINNKVGFAVSDALDSGWRRLGADAVVVTGTPANWGVGQPSIVSLDGAGKVGLFYAGDYGTRFKALDFTDSEKTTASLVQFIGDKGAEVSRTNISDLKGLQTSGMTITNGDFAYDADTRLLYLAVDTPDAYNAWYDDGQQGLCITKAVTIYRCALPELTEALVKNVAWERITRIVPSDIGTDWKTAGRCHNAGLVRTSGGALFAKTAMVSVANVKSDALYTYRFQPADWTEDAPADVVVFRPTSDTYLEADGNGGGFNTGFCPSTKTRVEADYRICVTNSGTRWLYGVQSSTGLQQFGLYCGKGDQTMTMHDGSKAKYYLGVKSGDGADRRYQSCFDLKSRQLSIRSDGLLLNSATIPEAAVAEFRQSGHPLALFTLIREDGKFYSSARIAARLYSLAIYEDDVLVRDYIPYGQGAVTGLLDRCSGKVSIPVASTDPGAQDAMSHFKLGTDAGYAESTIAKKQYLDTGIYADPTVKIDVSFTMMSTAKDESVFGTGSESDGFWCNFAVNRNGNFVWDFQDDVSQLHGCGVAADTVDRRIVIDGPGDKVQLYGGEHLQYEAIISSSLSGTSCSKTSKAPIVLFNRAYAEDAGAVSITRPASVRIRSAKIWKGGTLVRDYEPRLVDNKVGLFDRISESFFGAHATEAEDNWELGHGGAVTGTTENGRGATANLDAYLESDGDAYIATDYKLSGRCRLETEISLIRPHRNSRILGSDFYCWYMQGGNQSQYFSPGVTEGEKKANKGNIPIGSERWEGYVDWPKGECGLKCGGDVRSKDTFTSGVAYAAQHPLHLFCGYEGKVANKNAARLYRMSVYEDGNLVRMYLPCQIDGVAGLWETCQGTFLTNACSYGELRFGGAGTNGCGMVFAKQPKSCTLRTFGTNTLVAFAPTATAYQWYKNGEPIAGATKSTLKVDWEKEPETSVYKCVAFYALFGTAESNEAVVTNNPTGLCIFVR